MGQAHDWVRLLPGLCVQGKLLCGLPNWMWLLAMSAAMWGHYLVSAITSGWMGLGA